MKPKILVLELWGLGDLVIAGPFLRAASEQFEVTLVAKPFALELKPRFWPNVHIVPFNAPWTAFRHKYRLYSWPWREIARLRILRRERFQIGVSARWDPRDHLLLMLSSARRRIGFPRTGSRILLNEPLENPPWPTHRYEHWRRLGSHLGLALPANSLSPKVNKPSRLILVHSGAAQPVRVWPLERYQRMLARLRQQGHEVQVACDADQRSWWLDQKETRIATPRNISELAELVERAGIFIGNDSGSGHLAAALGIPTFTIFGPQLPALFAPVHPSAAWIEGMPCPHKPCFDSCRYAVAHCLMDLTEEMVWEKIQNFLSRTLSKTAA